MENKATILGIHEVAGHDGVWLIEMVLRCATETFDFSEITQAGPNLSRDNWQVAYDEQLIEKSDFHERYAFFFHCVDFSMPLRTPLGNLELPLPTPMPEHLRRITYEMPC